MDHDHLLFSVIVPAYNSGAFIKKCIESVLEQTIDNFELILVDDGSVDDTLSICEAYKHGDSRIRIIHKENGGHTSARRAGLKAACGKYILFLDSDDWLSHETLKVCEREIVSNAPDIVVFGMQNSNGSAPYQIRVSDGFYCGESLKKLMIDGLVMSKNGDFIFPKSLSAKCFRRDVIFDVQMTLPQIITIGEDGAAFVGATLNSSRVSVVANDKNACYFCLIRPDSVSATADPDAFDKANVLLSFYGKILTEDYIHQYRRCVVAQLYTAALYAMRSGEKNQELSAKLKTILADPILLNALKKSKFSLRGYKFLIKKFILSHRLWWLAKMIDG